MSTTPVEPQDMDPEVAMRSLGFDPAQVQTVVLTATSVTAVAVDYPEPYTPPQEAS